MAELTNDSFECKKTEPSDVFYLGMDVIQLKQNHVNIEFSFKPEIIQFASEGVKLLSPKESVK